MFESSDSIEDAIAGEKERWAPAKLLDEVGRPICTGEAIRREYAHSNPADPKHSGLAGFKLATETKISSEDAAIAAYVQFDGENDSWPISMVTPIGEDRNAFTVASFFYRDLMSPLFNIFN